MDRDRLRVRLLCAPTIPVSLALVAVLAFVFPAGASADPVAPGTEIVEAEKGRQGIVTRLAPAFFRFRSDTGAVGFECRLDRRPWRTCSSGRFLRFLGPGSHRFRVKAVDGEGVVDPTPAVRRWTFVRWRPDIRAAVSFAARRNGRTTFSIDLGWRSWGRAPGFRAPVASTIKAMLLVAYLRKSGVRDRGLTPYEKGLISPMIRFSDNGAANAVASMVGSSGMRRLARRAGMKGFEYSTIWGLSRAGAADQARFMRAVPILLPERHRAFALRLLSRVTGSQRWGIAKARPRGWDLFFKGGWGISDGRFGGTVNHQIALLRRGGLRIGLAILTQGNPYTSYGEATLRGVAGRLLKGLPRP